MCHPHGCDAIDESPEHVELGCAAEMGDEVEARAADAGVVESGDVGIGERFVDHRHARRSAPRRVRGRRPSPCCRCRGSSPARTPHATGRAGTGGARRRRCRSRVVCRRGRRSTGTGRRAEDVAMRVAGVGRRRERAAAGGVRGAAAGWWAGAMVDVPWMLRSGQGSRGRRCRRTACGRCG